jgi:hypothetical protein
MVLRRGPLGQVQAPVRPGRPARAVAGFAPDSVGERDGHSVGTDERRARQRSAIRDGASSRPAWFGQTGRAPILPLPVKESGEMKSRMLTFVAAAVALSFAAGARAKDCGSVKFHFKNEMSSKIKVRGVEIAGNDGTWTEDINNQEITTNGHHTTDGRNLNKLDSGATPSYMTVKYDKWDAANGQWLNNKTKKFDDRQECSDGKTYHFVMN